MKVGFFATCLANIFFENVARDAIEVLERLGCQVDLPENQTCCGQPQFNAGYPSVAKKMAKHMIEVYEPYDKVVSPSGSCTSMLKEYPHLFKDDPVWHEKSVQFANKVFEFTQFIVHELKITDVGAKLEGKATYHTSCHMTRILGEKTAPFDLLKKVKGLTLVDLPKRELCCGFGGTFAVKMIPISLAMVDEKVHWIQETGANILVGSDAGCLMNIGGRLERINHPMKVMHIAQVLNAT